MKTKLSDWILVLSCFILVSGIAVGYPVVNNQYYIFGDDTDAVPVLGFNWTGNETYVLPYNESLFYINETGVWLDMANSSGGGSSYLAGAGLNLTGLTFSLNGSIAGNNLTWDGSQINASSSGGGSVGGLYGINVEVLTGDKTLTVGTDKIYQYLDLDITSRNVILSTINATAGDRFYIKNTVIMSSTKVITFKQGDTILDTAHSGSMKEFIFDGINWKGIISGDTDSYNGNTAIGWKSQGRYYGTSVGSQATGSIFGAALGKTANGYNFGAALGFNANGNSFGVALGYNAGGNGYGVAIGSEAKCQNKYYSCALGVNAEATRYSELVRNIDGSSSDKNNIIIVGWSKSIADDTPIEIFCGGVANQRCTVRASSSLSFDLIVTARDNVANEVAKYSFDGLIKRDGAGNTVLSYLTTNVDYEDDATWDCVVTADDTNEALIITVTGDAVNVTQWVARLDGVETHF